MSIRQPHGYSIRQQCGHISLKRLLRKKLEAPCAKLDDITYLEASLLTASTCIVASELLGNSNNLWLVREVEDAEYLVIIILA